MIKLLKSLQSIWIQIVLDNRSQSWCFGGDTFLKLKALYLMMTKGFIIKIP